jgi:hypothetical protein
MPKVTIAIDPGAGGGIAWQDVDKRVWADPMPDGLSEIYEYLRGLIVMVDSCCVLEKTGSYMPGNSGPAAVTFARHCGNLEAILYTLHIPTEQVSPQKWMSPLNLPHLEKIKPGYGKKLTTDEIKKNKVISAQEKKMRKKAIQEKMARLYPHLRVTLKTADALGLLTYYLKG